MLSIKYYRKLSGMTQEQLAKALDVDQSAISHWERGEQTPLAKYRRKMATLFNTTEDKLLAAEADGS